MVDLGDATFLDSSAVSVLLKGRELTRQAGIVLRLGRVPPAIRTLLVTAGVIDLFGAPREPDPR